MLSVIREGRPAYGMGRRRGMDSRLGAHPRRGSGRPCPVWVPVWAAQCPARALESARPRPRRLRSSSPSWRHHLRPGRQRAVDSKTFPVFSSSPGFNAGGAYHFATWSGSAATDFTAASGADFAIVDNPGSTSTSAARVRSAAASAHDVSDGGRHAEFPNLSTTAKRPRASRLGRLGQPLRILPAAHAEVVPRTRVTRVLDRRGV